MMKPIYVPTTFYLVPSGPFRQTEDPRHRYEFIQGIANNFWRKLIPKPNYTPEMAHCQKEFNERRYCSHSRLKPNHVPVETW